MFGFGTNFFGSIVFGAGLVVTPVGGREQSISWRRQSSGRFTKAADAWKIVERKETNSALIEQAIISIYYYK